MTLRPAVFLDRDGTLMEDVHYCADPALVRLFPGTAAALRRLVESGFLCIIISNQSGIGRGILTEAQYHAVQTELLQLLREQDVASTGTADQIGSIRPISPIGPIKNQPHSNIESQPYNKLEPGAQAPHPEWAAETTSSLIAASYFCPDAPPTPSTRRKPESGMVLEAARDLGIDLARSWFIGDKSVDVECGQRAGTRTILVQTGYGAKEPGGSAAVSPDFVAKDIVEAVELVIQNSDALRK